MAAARIGNLLWSKDVALPLLFAKLTLRCAARATASLSERVPVHCLVLPASIAMHLGARGRISLPVVVVAPAGNGVVGSDRAAM